MEISWDEVEDVRYYGKSRSGSGGWDGLEGSGRLGRSKRIDEEKVDKY